jgi:hypothetical protein
VFAWLKAINDDGDEVEPISMSDSRPPHHPALAHHRILLRRISESTRTTLCPSIARKPPAFSKIVVDIPRRLLPWRRLYHFTLWTGGCRLVYILADVLIIALALGKVRYWLLGPEKGKKVRLFCFSRPNFVLMNRKGRIDPWPIYPLFDMERCGSRARIAGLSHFGIWYSMILHYTPCFV